MTGEKITTKGDANQTPDSLATPPKAEVGGEVIHQIPNAGFVLVFLQQPGGLTGVLTSIVALMLSWSLFFGRPTEA